MRHNCNSGHKRILMINDHIFFGGGGDAAFQYERAVYEANGHRVFTFCQSHGSDSIASENDFVFRESNSRIVRKIGKFTFSQGVYRSLKRYVQKIDPHFIKVHLVSKYPASIYAALLNVRAPVVQALHGPNLFCATSWGCLKSNGRDCEMGIGLKCYNRGCLSLPETACYALMNTMLQPLLRQTITHFISFSRHLCRSVQGLGFQAISFMPLGIERRFQELRPQGLSGPPTILFVGALVPQKGVHVLIDAFVRIKRQIQNARLVIAGKGIMEPALRLKAESYEFSKDIKFLGFVDRANIPGLYRQAHVVAVPSLWKEQFGLVGPEALSSGVPCVGSKIGGIPEWLHDGKWGFLVPIADSSLLAERIALLLTNDELRVRFGNEGRQFVLREYGPERYERNLIACLNKYTVET